MLRSKKPSLNHFSVVQHHKGVFREKSKTCSKVVCVIFCERLSYTSNLAFSLGKMG